MPLKGMGRELNTPFLEKIKEELGFPSGFKVPTRLPSGDV
jgi:hypothetical protein